jgi:hypothetical protein
LRAPSLPVNGEFLRRFLPNSARASDGSWYPILNGEWQCSLVFGEPWRHDSLDELLSIE